ncbi:hypothetical protein [Lederbergia graminis]|uniref:NADH dehydrogenase subunit 4 n=1 Tax=Lederbergia graminis TaxID=735518 RepID=A0ABW0LN92_9BACI
MKKMLRVIHIAVPVLFIFMLACITFVISDDLASGSWAFSSLMIFYPTLFFLQGSACSLVRGNIFVSLGISIASYIIVLLIWMNSSAIFYIFAYLLIGFLGYGFTHLIKKVFRTSNKS